MAHNARLRDARSAPSQKSIKQIRMMSEEREAMLYIMGFTLLIVCVGLLLV